MRRVFAYLIRCSVGALCLATTIVVPGTSQTPAVRPSPHRRAHHALVFDDLRQQVLLTGGSTPGEGGSCCMFFNDSWAFDGKTWTPLGESGTRMSGMRLYTDDERRVRSIGGFDGAAMGVMRTLRGTQWVVDQTMAPPAASEPGAAYDSRRKRVVLFGGSSGRHTLAGDTWEHDGRSWSKLSLAGPPTRQAHMMTYDSRRSRTVVFGGMGAAPEGQRPSALGDLWEFDGTQWVDRTPVGGPSPRHSAGVAFDSKRGRTLIFGGIGDGGILGDTWAWDGSQWHRLATTGPSPRAMGYMAYDAARDRVVLFGGRLGWPNDADDTWEFDGDTWRQVVARP